MNRSLSYRITHLLGIDPSNRQGAALVVVNSSFLAFALIFFIRDVVALLTNGDVFLSVTLRMLSMSILSVLALLIGRYHLRLSKFITISIPILILYVYPTLFIPNRGINESMIVNITGIYLACTIPFILFRTDTNFKTILIVNVLIFAIHLYIQYYTVFLTLPVKSDLILYFQTNYTILVIYQCCIWQFIFWVLYNTYNRNEKYQRELKEHNYTIHEQKNEIEAQNEELVQQQEQVFSMNERLELLVQERTLKLNRLNEKLIEYAYINSHLLRAPLCRIQGLRNLIKFDPANVKEYQVYLDRSLDELNEIIESISVILEDEDSEIIQEIQNKLRH
jgi:hypothetical protein